MIQSDGWWNRLGFAAWLAIAFGLISAAGMGRHEMWRDEIQSWMLARDSTSWFNLFENVRYETGHPGLWYYCLFGFSRLTRNPLTMPGFHLAIATASVYLVARCAPFSRFQKVLFAFGYFSLYEYGIVSRNYGLGMLLLFGVCALFRARHQRYLPLAGLLFLACNANFYSMLCAAAIAALLLLELLQQPEKLAERRWDVGVSAAIVIAGLLLFYLQIKQPTDAGIIATGVKPLSLKAFVSAVALLWKSYAPIPWLTLNFWNTNLVREGDAALLSVLLFVGAIAVLIRKPLILFLYLSGTLTIILFALVKHGGGVRHWGYAFVLLVICLWLAPEFPNSTWRSPAPLLRLHHWLTQRHCIFFTVLLVLQVMAGWFAYSMDWVFPFSQGKATAQLIQQNSLNQYLLVGDRDWAAVPVSGYLDQAVYYPASDRVGTFLIFNNQRDDRPIPEVIRRINQHLTTNPQTAILVFNYELSSADLALFQRLPSPIGQFTGAIVTDENYFLYQMQP